MLNYHRSNCYPILLCFFWVTSTLANEPADQDRIFTREVFPLLESYCGHCHGPDEQQAGIRVDELGTDLTADREIARKWRRILQVLETAEMPPADEAPLDADTRTKIIGWITMSIDQAIEKQRNTAGRVVLRRLNREEYQNTMFDLLGLEMDYVRDLPPDSLSPDGYRNNGQTLSMSAIQLEYYLDTARRALGRVMSTGPPAQVFRYRFEQSNVDKWRGPTEISNRLERAQKFLAKMVDDYPEEGEFRVRVQTRAGLKPDKGFPLLEVSVGYRPDTQVDLRVAGVREVLSEEPQQFEFRGRLENFPLPVRGQGKFPGLVIHIRNAYDDGTPIPAKLEKVQRDGQELQVFAEEPDLPHLLIEAVEFEGPYYAQWPPELHRRILFESELRETDPDEYLRQVLERFMSRAFRRPANEAEVDRMIDFYESIRPHFPSFEDAVRETLALVLIQPDFLFLVEPSGDQQRELNSWEIASRLSYFLWSTMPDDRLFELADSDALREPIVLAAEVNRMLKDRRSGRLAQQFSNQWLRVENLDRVSIDKGVYPDFDDALKVSMQQETTEFFAELLRGNESALQLLDSTFTMLNEPLARHYGIDGVRGINFSRVSLPGTAHRGGLLGQGSILLANSSGRDSHAIRRAVWIRDRLLGDPPAPPPPNVPELSEVGENFLKMSLREQLVVHREQEGCGSCHRDLDPWGIALENFDAVGRWRETIRLTHGKQVSERPVVAEDVLPDGTRIAGADDLRTYLLEHRHLQFARTLVVHLMTYALGRSLDLADEIEVDELTQHFITDGYRLRPLLHQIVVSDAFRMK